MALSRLAAEFAAEIRQHDWSDAPFRADRAGHSRAHDTHASSSQLPPAETDAVRTNVMWVTAQVLAFSDPNFDLYEYAEASGVDTRTPSGRPRSGWISSGLRIINGVVCKPGTYDYAAQTTTVPTSQRH